jgi:hypothetical protein
MNIPKFGIAGASNQIYQDFKGVSWRDKSYYHSTSVLNVCIPNFRLARASNQFYQDFEDVYSKLLDSSREQF